MRSRIALILGAAMLVSACSGTTTDGSGGAGASPDVVYVSLAVDPNERAEDLAIYADREGYDWTFAIASADVSRSLAATFGDQVLSPPSTPLIILGPHGQLIEKHIGMKSADDLAALFEEHLP